MNLKSASINVDGEGIKLSPAALKSGGSLCELCSIQQTCTLNDAVVGITSIERCTSFTPALSFVPPILGLDGVFSTFRASSIWYERARVIKNSHGLIGLYDAKLNEKIGTAKLLNAFRGRFADLMLNHALSNHLCKGRTDLDKVTAGPWLTKQIRNLAGSRYVKSPSQVCTVMLLERVS